MTMKPFFAYGTLKVESIMHAVTGKNFPSEPATLMEYGCYTLKARPYPGIKPEPGAKTPGLLYHGISEEIYRKLDAYEDDFYQRRTLIVKTAKGADIEAEVYTIPEIYWQILESRPWTLETFLKKEKNGFLQTLTSQ